MKDLHSAGSVLASLKSHSSFTMSFRGHCLRLVVNTIGTVLSYSDQCLQKLNLFLFFFFVVVIVSASIARLSSSSLSSSDEVTRCNWYLSLHIICSLMLLFWHFLQHLLLTLLRSHLVFFPTFLTNLLCLTARSMITDCSSPGRFESHFNVLFFFT